jgi:hypothetical protein
LVGPPRLPSRASRARMRLAEDGPEVDVARSALRATTSSLMEKA